MLITILVFLLYKNKSPRLAAKILQIVMYKKVAQDLKRTRHKTKEK